MNCKCKEIHEKILGVIRSRRKEFEIAFQDGPDIVRKVKYEVIKDVKEVIENYEICNCFLGQNLQKISELLKTYFDNIKILERDLNPTAFKLEKDKIFDKINLLLNTK